MNDKLKLAQELAQYSADVGTKLTNLAGNYNETADNFLGVFERAAIAIASISDRITTEEYEEFLNILKAIIRNMEDNTINFGTLTDFVVWNNQKLKGYSDEYEKLAGT